MVGELLSSVGGWLSRLFARLGFGTSSARGSTPAGEENPAAAKPTDIADASQTAPETRTGDVSGEELRQPVAATGGLTEAATSAGGAPSRLESMGHATTTVAPDQAEKCLAEVLGVDAVPVARAAHQPVDPLAREQTLAGLNGLRQIPALQSLAQGFLRAMNQPEVAVNEVISAIEKDSALCVRVLRMANSVLVSPEMRIEDLDTAVQMLGVARVRKAAQALFTLRDANRVAEGFDWRHLWIHALGTAAIAEELEQQLRGDANSHIYLAALLHDVGKIVLSTIAPDAYRDVLVFAWNENGRLEELERERLGVDHREAGVLFARHNELPEVVIEAIAHHDRPEQAENFRFEVALVSIANYLSKAHGLGFSGARLDERDGEFADLPAWELVAETCGFRPDAERIEDEMNGFIAALRADLRALRDDI